MSRKLYNMSIQYAQDVLEGKEITTWEVQKQCEIFLNDLDRHRNDLDWEFYFDMDKLEDIETILSCIHLATGARADFVGASFLDLVAPYQAFLITNIFAWRYKKNPNKFKHSFIVLYIARKNARFLVL